MREDEELNRAMKVESPRLIMALGSSDSKDNSPSKLIMISKTETARAIKTAL